jgi:hydrogenase maturation factor
VVLTTDVAVGDWVLIYGGAVIAVIDQETARESIRLIEALKP